MTNTEATAVNTLLNHLGVRNLGGLDGREQSPAPHAREAAAFLADRAHKTLSAGRRRADVERDWPVVAATLEAGRGKEDPDAASG
jgi:hypothetical protein